jgi:long-chain acyl-CoA synthetase
VVFGANRPFLAAVLAVSEASLRNRLRGGAPAAGARATAEAVRADIAEATRDLPGYLRPAGVVLTTRPFSIADGLVTPNLKVRRRQGEATFGAHLEDLFARLSTRSKTPEAIAYDDDVTLLAV